MNINESSINFTQGSDVWPFYFNRSYDITISLQALRPQDEHAAVTVAHVQPRLLGLSRLHF